MTESEFRLLPEITPETEHFWRGGERSELVFLRCASCRTYVHPPSPICPECLGRDLAPEAVSGRGTVATFTVNHQPWNPSVTVPYVIALVEIDEQQSLRLMTNIVGCPPDEVRVGMRVRVTFAQHDDVYLPLFEPDE
ncbi:MAG: OB-fold domain-containing protein [Chloroflexi bacterium]|nr:OB-fold domain-containing protein [Chloroflexota bacterium]